MIARPLGPGDEIEERTLEIPAWLWAAFTIGACATQTVRNAMQRHLTERLGTIGATHVRFLFGLPFGLLFLLLTWAVVGLDGLRLSGTYASWALAGGVAQIAGTALMLAAMRERSFVVATAYLKTEPVQIALFGLVFLGDRLTLQSSLAVLLATAGVLLMSLPGRAPDSAAATRLPGRFERLRPAVFGIASGAMFALSAVGFRGAILALGDAPFYMRATTTLATTLTMQTVLLTAWLLIRSPRVLGEIFRAWRPSLAAGAAGAFASQMWFLAFSLQTAAAVRTVGLLELLFAQVASRRLFSQRLSRREGAGILMMVGGLTLLLTA